jgi:hypothetical protein
MTERGTALIVLAVNEGVVMVADDLVYALKGGVAVPAERNVRKIFAAGNILIGTAGTMRAKQSGQLTAVGEAPQTVAIEYKYEDWIVEFIRGQRSASDSDPEAVADALYTKMRETFEPVEVFLEHGGWGDHAPGDRLVNYVVAGYSKNFKNFHLFELGVEYNPEGNGLRYLAPIRHAQKFPQDLRFGEDESISRVFGGLEPETSVRRRLWSECLKRMDAILPAIPEPLQDTVASAVSLVKVEAKFNPNKVGDTVKVLVLDRAAKKRHLATF